MCKVHNSIGCLTAIKNHLKQHNINDFSSLNDLLNFQRNFSSLRQQIISNHEQQIENEKVTLPTEIVVFDNAIKTDRIYFERSFLSEIEELKQKLIGFSTSNGLESY